jgi:proteasome assembly chaperone (PAC2) family protein
VDDLVELWETPSAKEVYMIAGWRQWADAGSVSSGLPQYLIQRTKAKKIAAIKPADFYLFQIPGTHHLLRPEIKLEQGYRVALRESKNEIFYTGDKDKGLLIFLGDEPHLNADRYAEAFFYTVKALGVKRVAAVGGVYGAMPYDKDREVSCVYSLRSMKDELGHYAVRFSDYEGGSTIGTYLADKAEPRGIELLAFYAFVPSYDFGQLSNLVQGMRVENDYKAWYDLMRRFNHMFNLKVDLSDLERRGDELVAAMDDKVDELAQEMPQLNVREYIERLATDFTERPFMPLGDVWKRALDDLFDDTED